ncbi:MAG: hypothetical protein LBG89_00230 [Rickettsiales bacterium]|jgi:hypothetical protein|nr:hypothetical protein [Rickettsiales bacterium]
MKKLPLLLIALSLAACAARPMDIVEVQTITNYVIDEHSVPIFPRKAALTTDIARRFSIDLPKRCHVDWDNQSVISVLPAEEINIFRTDRGDPLPELYVNDYKFSKKKTAAAVAGLVEGTGITIVVADDIEGAITGEIKAGSLADAIDLITRMGRVYYSYDAFAKEIRLSARTQWLMKMPRDQYMIMAIMDAMRGIETRNLIVNWEDKTMMFEGDFRAEKAVRRLMAEVGSKKNLVAWDMDVYRIYPKNNDALRWMDVIPAFGEKNIKMSVPGVVGRMLVVSPEINTKTIQEFLRRQSNLVLISQGTFVIPNGWNSRFDIGQCSKEDRLETELIVGATGKYGDFADQGKNKIDANIVLYTKRGELSSFRVPTNIGDNYIIIGIPTHSFVHEPETLISPFAELVVFISPRIISVLQPDESNLERVPGDLLRERLAE